MNPEQVPIPLEKTIKFINGAIEVSIAEVSMTDKEKKVYKKFMAKCVSSSSKDKKDAMVACAVDFKKMKEQLMAEDEEEDEEEEEEDVEEDVEEDDEEEDESVKEKSESAAKKQNKMEYREKVKTPGNSINIITIEQINKWEKAEKNETQLDEQKETKTVWRNTVDL
jgi:hypothetical protein